MMRKLYTVLALVAAGCTPPDSGETVNLGNFEAQIDEGGQLMFRRLDAKGAPIGEFAAGLTMIPDVQDGVPGSGPNDTVELVTNSVAQGISGCGRANSYCASVTMRSFYMTQHLQTVWVEMTSQTPTTGYTAYNSSPGAPAGVVTTFGDWSYGTLPSYKSTSTVTWGFNFPSTSGFTFQGAVLGTIVGVATGPSLTANPTAGAAGSSVSLTGANFQAGESVKIYFDSTASTALATVTGAGFTQAVTVPATATAGAHQFIAVGPTSGQATANFTVNAWNQIAAVTGTPKSLTISPDNSAAPPSVTILCGTSTGIWHSADGVTWGVAGPTNVSAISGMPMATISFASLTDGTATMTGNGGTSWAATGGSPGIVIGPRMMGVPAVGPFGPAASGTSVVVVKANGAGASWIQSAAFGTGTGTSVAWGGASTLFIGVNGSGGGVFKGTGSPTTLSAFTKLAGFPQTQVLSLAASLSTPTTMYAGTNAQGAGVYKTTDGGTTWTAAGTGLGNLVVRALSVDPSNANNVFAGTAAGIYITTNGGTTWSFSGLGSSAINDLSVKYGTPKTVFATTGSGLFVTTTGGL
jgi:hypothetical protein